MLTLNREQSRNVDRLAVAQYGMTGLVLMENAGRGCAELLLKLGISGRVAICCGGGNNGGDGFVIARHLENAGVEVDVGLFAEESRIEGDAAANLRILRAAGTPVRVLTGDASETDAFLSGADWIVDALLGTGGTGPVRGPLAGVIAAINRQGRRVLAIDLPSGLDCDTGRPRGAGACIRATHTATMVSLKPGFVRAVEYTGEVHVIDIGIPRRLLTAFNS